MHNLTFTVDLLPPTANHYWLLNRNGSRRLSDAAISFRSIAGYAARVAASEQAWQYPTDARLSVSVRFRFATRHKQDIANREKCLIDSIAPVLGFDDSVIDRLLLERDGYEKGKPRCEIVVEVLP